MKASARFTVSDAEMSIGDIARVMGLTERQVWVIYKTAMRKIRRQMTPSKRLRELVECRTRMREMQNG